MLTAFPVNSFVQYDHLPPQDLFPKCSIHREKMCFVELHQIIRSV